jgi:two-component sensor histidine kinase
LIAVELLINAIKHAFPDNKQTGLISVGYETNGDNWELLVSEWLIPLTQ